MITVIIIFGIGTLIFSAFGFLSRKRIRRGPCEMCYGTGIVEHIGEGISEPCEHCDTYTLKHLRSE